MSNLISGAPSSSFTDPRIIAKTLLGPVDWQNEVTGYCTCPGQALHTHKTGKKDCRVCLDGAPTVHCFHSSCSILLAETNRSLRRALGASPWKITLPSGRVLRSGDVMQSSGTVLPRELVSHIARAEGRTTEEQTLLETIKALAERFKPDLLEKFRWPYSQIQDESPLQLAHRDGEDQFRLWLTIWPAHSHVWIGDVYSSGQPKHKAHFRSVADWCQIGPVMGNFTCGSSFKPGTFSRSNENCAGHRFLVVESDTLTKDEIGAVFRYINRVLHFGLHAIIDTAGKSLHGWFDAPINPTLENQLKATLTAFGCDPKLFTTSQPVRVPGAYRNGKMQQLIWKP